MKQFSILPFTSILITSLSCTVACFDSEPQLADLPGGVGSESAGGGPGEPVDPIIHEVTGGGLIDPPTCQENPGTQAYLCAGYASEENEFSARVLNLTPVGARGACERHGTSLAQAAGVNPMEGEGDIEWEDAPDPESEALPSQPPDYWPGTGGSTGGATMGGASGDGDGDGDWVGTGGGLMGGAGGGEGGGPNEPPYDEAWCDEFPDNWLAAGITFSLDDCGNSELALPLRFQEPEDWYRLRVYVGESPCERGELVLEQAGYGTGDLLTVDPGTLPAGFVTIELVDEGNYYYDDYYYYDYYEDDYYWHPYYYGGDHLRLELNDLSRPGIE